MLLRFLQKRMMDKTGLNLTADVARGQVDSMGIISANIRCGKPKKAGMDLPGRDIFQYDCP
jgi:hypothetical protein